MLEAERASVQVHLLTDETLLVRPRAVPGEWHHCVERSPILDDVDVVTSNPPLPEQWKEVVGDRNHFVRLPQR